MQPWYFTVYFYKELLSWDKKPKAALSNGKELSEV